MSSKSICIVSGGDEVRHRSYVNHRIFALEQGYRHRLEIALARSISVPYYFKLQAIENVLEDQEWTLWVDDDVYFTDWGSSTLDRLVRDASSAGKFLVVAEGPRETNGAWSRINTGVMLLRRDERTRRLLSTARAADLSQVRAWWDEDAFGLFTNGDQDTIWWGLCTRKELMEGTTIVSHELLNSRPHHYGTSLSDCFAVHFCGPGDKELRTAQFGRRFGLGQELVPTHLLDKYSVRRRETMPDTEIGLRQARQSAAALRRRVRNKIDWIRSTGRWR